MFVNTFFEPCIKFSLITVFWWYLSTWAQISKLKNWQLLFTIPVFQVIVIKLILLMPVWKGNKWQMGPDNRSNLPDTWFNDPSVTPVSNLQDFDFPIWIPSRQLLYRWWNLNGFCCGVTYRTNHTRVQLTLVTPDPFQSSSVYNSIIYLISLPSLNDLCNSPELHSGFLSLGPSALTVLPHLLYLLVAESPDEVLYAYLTTLPNFILMINEHCQ